MDASNDDGEALIIGFDVGTAFSTVAYTLAPSSSNLSDDVNLTKTIFDDIATVPFSHGPQTSSQLAWYHAESCWVSGFPNYPLS